MTKVNPFPALTTLAPSIAAGDAVAANGARTFLTKGTSSLVSAPANLSYKAPRNHPDLIILDICALLSFISIGSKSIAYFSFYLVVRNNY